MEGILERAHLALSPDRRCSGLSGDTGKVGGISCSVVTKFGAGDDH